MMMMLTTMPMPPNVAISPNVLTNASLEARSMRAAYQRCGRRCRSLRGTGRRSASIDGTGASGGRSGPGEGPERLNGRYWKSRNGGNLVRGFESLPLRWDSRSRDHADLSVRPGELARLGLRAGRLALPCGRECGPPAR